MLGVHKYSYSININRACLLCSQDSRELLCHTCIECIRFFDYQHCFGNLLSLPQVRAGLPDCKFDRLLALGDYQWPLSNLVSKLKFSRQLYCAKIIARLFVDRLLQPEAILPDLILPVPLGVTRFSRRKFNQAHEIATYIGQFRQIPVDSSLLNRRVDTLPQTSLSAAQRRQNLQNAFVLVKPLLINHIAIFDDVVTTGATVNAIITLLKKHNPRLKVEVWATCVTLAR